MNFIIGWIKLTRFRSTDCICIATCRLSSCAVLKGAGLFVPNPDPVETRGFSFTSHLGSISSTFYKQLWSAQILKAQKDSQVVNLFYAFKICGCKSCSKNVDEINTWQSLSDEVVSVINEFAPVIAYDLFRNQQAGKIILPGTNVKLEIYKHLKQ